MTYPLRLSLTWAGRMVVACAVPVSRVWTRTVLEAKWRMR
jgi:hypothetical protein